MLQQKPRPSAFAGRAVGLMFVSDFGTVSLVSDFVCEGALSVTGVRARIGATALIVGSVTGIGEAAAPLPRLVAGPRVDRTERFWSMDARRKHRDRFQHPIPLCRDHKSGPTRGRRTVSSAVPIRKMCL